MPDKPKDCKCDSNWSYIGNSVSEICDNYIEDAQWLGLDRCGNCEHDKTCHKGEK